MANISDEEFFARAILHYITVSKKNMGFMSDDIANINRLEVHNNSKQILKIIDEATANKLLINIVQNLFEGKVAIPFNEEEFVIEVMRDFKKELNIEEIPFKENIAKNVSYILKINDT